MQKHFIKTAVVGANGYSGLELARLLLVHPQAELVACFARDGQWQLSHELPESAAKKIPTVSLEMLSQEASKLDTVFLATPAEVSMKLVEQLYQLPQKSRPQIIDLSGAFRLDSYDYAQWYGTPHTCLDALQEASYGLVPWQKSHPSRLVSNPGCFATSVLMGILPLLQAKIIQPETLVIDSKSGTSGAGRKAQERLLFTEVDGDCLPYRIGNHQHWPEIVGYAKHFAGVTIDPIFTTSLIPTRRGILSSIYARLLPGKTAADVGQAFLRAYEGDPLIRVEPLGQSIHQDHAVLSLRKVVGSPRTHIGYQVTANKLHLFSSIDNLLKGAASQAIENFNILNGLEKVAGLIHKEGLL